MRHFAPLPPNQLTPHTDRQSPLDFTLHLCLPATLPSPDTASALGVSLCTSVFQPPYLALTPTASALGVSLCTPGPQPLPASVLGAALCIHAFCVGPRSFRPIQTIAGLWDVGWRVTVVLGEMYVARVRPPWQQEVTVPPGRLFTAHKLKFISLLNYPGAW